MRLTWNDVDVDGSRHESGKYGPTIRVANTKGNRRKAIKRPLFIPLYRVTVEALSDLRTHPVALARPHTPFADRAVRAHDGQADEDEHVFPVRGYAHPGCEVSKRFAKLCSEAGLTDSNGKHRWTLQSLRRKANEDIQRAGGSLPEQMALTGHRSAQVNVVHYQSADPGRMRELVAGMSGFKGLSIVRETA